MATNRAQVRSYVEHTTKQKFNKLCQKANRSESNMVETLILEYIEKYEAEHGEIPVEEEGQE